MKLLNFPEARNRANSKDCSLNNENWINDHWHHWKFQLYNKFGDINDIIYLNLLKWKIKGINNSELMKLINDLIVFYSEQKWNYNGKYLEYIYFEFY